MQLETIRRTDGSQIWPGTLFGIQKKLGQIRMLEAIQQFPKGWGCSNTLDSPVNSWPWFYPPISGDWWIGWSEVEVWVKISKKLLTAHCSLLLNKSPGSQVFAGQAVNPVCYWASDCLKFLKECPDVRTGRDSTFLVFTLYQIPQAPWFTKYFHLNLESVQWLRTFSPLG